MALETSLVLVKPDGVQRGLIGQVIARFEAKGLKIVGLKMLKPSRDLLEKHYDVHKERPFFESLLGFMSSAPVVAMAVTGNGAIDAIRTIVGPTNGAEAPGGSIRGDFGMSKSFNIVHASDGADTAAYELPLWFAEGEIIEWTQDGGRWVDDPDA